MNTIDIGLHETGAGGDFAIVNNDLLLSEALYQQFYIALFGGNIEANTRSEYMESEERFDYWGNSLFWKEKPTKQFNSETERTINNVVLNSSGRLSILRAVTNDLQYLQSVVNFTVSVSILSTNKVEIAIDFTGKSNQQNKVLQMVYDNAKRELIINKLI